MTTPDMVLIQYPGLGGETTLSPLCGKVQMALRFKSVPFTVKNVTSPMEARRYNPRGRVPVLQAGDTSLVDSTDILDWLDARFPDPPLEPGDAAARALARILEDWADDVLYFYSLYMRVMVADNFARMKQVALSRLPAPARWLAPWLLRREMHRRTSGQGVALKGEAVVRREIEGCYSQVAALVDVRPFLTGETLSRANLAVAALLDQHRLAQLTPGLAAAIEAHSGLTAWLDRVHARAGAAI